MGAGRFAPSPSGPLHLGNLRTAILAWLFARSTDRDFLLRIEDLDRVRSGAETTQINELASLGLDFDGEMLRQSDRLPVYLEAVERLKDRGLVYECFCSRKDIAEAGSAPHAAPGAYPGTCRELSPSEREAKAKNRPAALRLRSQVNEFSVHDELFGDYTGAVDDFVLIRNDGAPAYNLAVVVDDAFSGIDQVVRGDDLLSSAPRQAYLATLLDYEVPVYAHVPLALNSKGQRLAKRDGAVTLEEITEQGLLPANVVTILLESLGLPSTSLQAALQAFDPAALPREPWIVDPENIVQQLMPPASRNR
ncbi:MULTISPECIES: tRNA glutamyl-Q(34) synthetase GluQRS [Glutamicibacter]|uniref:Glutamyl-Q tRNA(Asp) synthetase n=2 Tax=Glutamicibacter arilaitensis TaxID=256701 RepID=A0A2N7S031_9MICC|nr:MULTISPECIES: tRNA glutamyl-Q(34) synthetase GluQRS [Glutamicibacter]PMQ19501.1 tRNA glutamyl-Q(34) synthetase GluQRS [Glutamicibacter arilaitensis]CBT74553.1 putative glutamate--tRNA ligase [Glutamicibacter arilaitensis Re117]HCH47569.1 tRNA glutamyl-Q(34) synthetase GluQRS [Glutamicibacter sp.]HCJ53873.1 tRNA glutamyl-Q(34) synthetase GluQRS [Glutamicibacter sp.]HCM94610.1 tRNA glutamyl-Q(34) synthetase GluQRS [Glutamicibacter sp.]